MGDTASDVEAQPENEQRRRPSRAKSRRALPGGEAPIAFVHIPKTAGGTLKSMFSEAFGRDAVHNSGNYLRNPERTAKQPFHFSSATRITIGHIHYGLLREHLPPETRYITFLREPVDRVISHYYRHLQGKAETIDAALESGMPHLTNLMTRFLCGHTDILGDLPDTALNDAKASLERFEFVGFQERFDESLLLLQEKLGMPKIAYGASRHVNDARPDLEDLGDEERAFIAAHNSLDVELYEWARARFDREMAARGDGLNGEVAMLRDESAAKVTEQARRTELAVGWLTSALPAGTSRPLDELTSEAESAGFRLPELKRAKRQLKPACRNLFTDSGLHWEMRVPGEPGTRRRERNASTSDHQARKRERKLRRTATSHDSSETD